MSFPSWGRLERLYHDRMLRLFGGRIWELIDNPDLVRDPIFQERARKLAGGIASEIAEENSRSWRSAAMRATRARQIYAALRLELETNGLLPQLQRIALRNADLISSVPRDVGRRIARRAAELQLAGARAEEIERELKPLAKEMASSRLRLIARSEISRAETDITRARSEKLGIEYYQWHTSEDQRVRQSHRKMDGVLVPWNDSPSPEGLVHEASTLGHYHAGQCPNCRCVAVPIADLAEVAWPAMVYGHDRIVRMTRTQFTRLVGLPMAA